MEKKKQSNKNREFTVITYFFLFLFLAMMGYFVFFLTLKSESFINSPYNSLQDLFSEHVIRGEIRSADGHVLAKTEVEEDGTENRIYPYGRTFAHVVGFSTNGKAGLEKQANFQLLRSHAFFLEQIVNDVKGEKSIGDHVITTLDFDMQSIAYDALSDYDGAVIVMEPSTGKILCMVSKPTFNPNTIDQDWEDIISGESSVLFNRATQGQYTPGSVFKIFTTLEYYRENKNTYNNYFFDCKGKFNFENKTIHCASNQSHGEEDLMDSFANSCNSSYANLALEIDQDALQELCNSLLFNMDLPIAFESGKSKVNVSNDMGYAAIMETGIGQGNTLVSPLHMVMLAGAIDNDGVLMRPYLIEHTENYNGVLVSENESIEYGTMFSPDEVELLRTYMSAVVEEGTAQKLSGQSYTAYGKTGTAQVSDTTGQENSWFVGFASKEGYEDIAIAVVVEDFSSKSITGVTVAKKIFDSYFTGGVY